MPVAGTVVVVAPGSVVVVTVVTGTGGTVVVVVVAGGTVATGTGGAPNITLKSRVVTDVLLWATKAKLRGMDKTDVSSRLILGWRVTTSKTTPRRADCSTC